MMRAMEARNARARKSLRLALAASVLLHAAAALVNLSASGRYTGTATRADKQADGARSRLLATIVSPPSTRPIPAPHRDAAAATAARRQPAAPQAAAPRLTTPAGLWPSRSWSRAEREDMDSFLDELAQQARPRTGSELAQNAITMVRELGQSAPDETEADSAAPASAGDRAEAFSLEMYFDAFIRKLNRSAAFVKVDPGGRGRRKALVQISLYPDGRLKSYRVLRAADQAAQIAYIKQVIDRASPFSAFPPDLVLARGSLSILMCIFAAHAGDGGGFSRSFGAQDCKD